MEDPNPYSSPTEFRSADGTSTVQLTRAEERILRDAVRASKERWLDMGIVVPAIVLLAIVAYHYYRGYQHAVSAGSSIGEILRDEAGGFRDRSYDGDYVRAIDKLMSGTIVLFVAGAMLWFARHKRKRALLMARLYALLRVRNLIPSVDAVGQTEGHQKPD